MPYEVSESGPQMWEIALNLEYWDKLSWKSRIPSGILFPKSVNCTPHLWIDELLVCERRTHISGEDANARTGSTGH